MSIPTYYSLPTPAGEAELAGALAAQVTVPFTHIAIGDGNGQPVVPDGRTTLVHQVDQVQITSIRQHPVHANWIILEAAVPEDRGGYVIRELAVKGGRTPGTVLAMGNHPAVEKPAPDSGAAEALILRMVVAFVHGTAAISLAIDPMAYATLQTVLDQIAAHEGKVDPHPQYLTKAEGDAIYDAVGAAAGAAGTGMAAHLAAPDPHPQYLTKPEGDAAYDASGAAASVAAADAQRMADHLAATNPHAQYQTKADTANAWAEQFFYAAGM